MMARFSCAVFVCPHGGCVGDHDRCRGVCYCYGVSLSKLNETRLYLMTTHARSLMINVEKLRVSLSRFTVLAHRLEIEMGRWNKPKAVPLNEIKY